MAALEEQSLRAQGRQENRVSLPFQRKPDDVSPKVGRHGLLIETQAHAKTPRSSFWTPTRWYSGSDGRVDGRIFVAIQKEIGLTAIGCGEGDHGAAM
jgi:hypothetical protein